MSRAFAGLIAVSLLAGPSTAAGQNREFHRTVDLQADGTVSIHTFKGSVAIETWDRAQAEVIARIEPDTSCGSEAEQQERVRLTEVDVDATASRLEVRSDYDRLKDLPSTRIELEDHEFSCNAYPFIHYRLRIPRTARLDVEDHKSKIDLAGLRSEVRIRTHKGSVDVKDHDGGLDLSTHKGDVRVEFARFAASRFETHKGDIEITMPRSAGFDLDATVGRGGRLDSGFDLAERALSRRERAYEQPVNRGGPRLELSTKKGSIRIR